MRLQHLGEMGDIERAISSLEDAVRPTPDRHVDKPNRLSNLGSSLLMCFEHHGEMGDIEKTISSLEDAVQLTPDGHAEKPSLLNNLAFEVLRASWQFGRHREGDPIFLKTSCNLRQTDT